MRRYLLWLIMLLLPWLAACAGEPAITAPWLTPGQPALVLFYTDN